MYSSPINTEKFSFSCGIPARITLTDNSPASVLIEGCASMRELIILSGEKDEQFFSINSRGGRWPHPPLTITIALGGVSLRALDLLAVSCKLSAQAPIKVGAVRINLTGGDLRLDEMVRCENARISMVKATAHVALNCSGNLSLHCVGTKCVLVWPELQRGVDLSWVASRVEVHGTRYSGIGHMRYPGSGRLATLRLGAVDSRIDVVPPSTECFAEGV